MNECPLKRDHFKWTFHLPTINFQGIYVSFQGRNFHRSMFIKDSVAQITRRTQWVPTSCTFQNVRQKHILNGLAGRLFILWWLCKWCRNYGNHFTYFHTTIKIPNRKSFVHQIHVPFSCGVTHHRCNIEACFLGAPWGVSKYPLRRHHNHSRSINLLNKKPTCAYQPTSLCLEDWKWIQ